MAGIAAVDRFGKGVVKRLFIELLDDEPALSRVLRRCKHRPRQPTHTSIAASRVIVKFCGCHLLTKWFSRQVHHEMIPLQPMGLGEDRMPRQLHLSDSTIWTWLDEDGLEWKRQQSWFHDAEKHDPEFVEKRGA